MSNLESGQCDTLRLLCHLFSSLMPMAVEEVRFDGLETNLTSICSNTFLCLSAKLSFVERVILVFFLSPVW